MNIPFYNQQFFDNSGKPLSGGKLYTYTAGSTTLPKSLYYDAALTTPAPNPLILDSAGRPDTYYMTSGGYNIMLKSSSDVLIDSWDNQYGTTSNGSGSGSDTYKSMVDQYDTNPDYLVNKIVSGDGIDVVEVIAATRTLEINSQGKVKTNSGDTVDYLGNKFTDSNTVKWSVVGNKMVGTVEISAVDSNKVKVWSGDTSASYLQDKFEVSDTINIFTNLTTNKISFSVNTSEVTGDHKIAVDGSDTTVGFLSDKIKAGAGITITSAADISGTKLYINSRTNSWRPIKYVSSDYTVQDNDDTVVVRSNFGNVTLPTAAPEYEGRIVTVQAAGIGFGTTVIAASGNIMGGNSVVYNYSKAEFFCVNDGSTWIWIAR